MPQGSTHCGSTYLVVTRKHPDRSCNTSYIGSRLVPLLVHNFFGHEPPRNFLWCGKRTRGVNLLAYKIWGRYDHFLTYECSVYNSYVYPLYAILANPEILVRHPCILVETLVHTNRALTSGVHCVKIWARSVHWMKSYISKHFGHIGHFGTFRGKW